MNTRTHTLPAGTLEAAANVNVPAPDLLEIISRTCPGQDGVSILYSLANGLGFRIARLAAIITNIQATRLVDAGELHINDFNEALAALDEYKSKHFSFSAAGLEHQDMFDDLKGLVNFQTRVIDKIVSLTKKPFPINWIDTITKAAQPRAVEEWKLVDGWEEYLEACHGKPEMTEAEHREMETLELAGKKQNWGAYIPQIINTISLVNRDDELEFDDLPVTLQNALLASLSTDEKEATLRLNAKKMARTKAELHTKRVFISSFVQAARLALTHSRYANVE